MISGPSASSSASTSCVGFREHLGCGVGRGSGRGAGLVAQHRAELATERTEQAAGGLRRLGLRRPSRRPPASRPPGPGFARKRNAGCLPALRGGMCRGGGGIDSMTDHRVELRLVERCGLQLALVDAAHPGGFGDASLAGLAADECAHVRFAALGAGIVDAHVVHAHEPGRAGRQLQLVPEPLLRGDLHRGVTREARDLGRAQAGLGVHVDARLLHDGGYVGRVRRRNQQDRRNQGQGHGAHHESPFAPSGGAVSASRRRQRAFHRRCQQPADQLAQSLSLAVIAFVVAVVDLAACEREPHAAVVGQSCVVFGELPFQSRQVALRSRSDRGLGRAVPDEHH